MALSKSSLILHSRLPTIDSEPSEIPPDIAPVSEVLGRQFFQRYTIEPTCPGPWWTASYPLESESQSYQKGLKRMRSAPHFLQDFEQFVLATPEAQRASTWTTVVALIENRMDDPQLLEIALGALPEITQKWTLSTEQFALAATAVRDVFTRDRRTPAVHIIAAIDAYTALAPHLNKEELRAGITTLKILANRTIFVNQKIVDAAREALRALNSAPEPSPFLQATEFSC